MKSVQDAAGCPWKSENGGAAFRCARFLERLARVAAGLLLTVLVAPGQQYVISTFAGGGPPLSPVPALSISLGTVWGVANDAAGNAYLSSSDLNSVFRLDSTGQLTLIAGDGRVGYSGDGALAVAAQLNALRGVAVDTAGNVFVADMGNGCVRRVSPSGVITTVPGSTNLQSPFAVAVDGFGNLFVAELNGNRVDRISLSGEVTPVAGNGTRGFSGDLGAATSAQLNGPTGVAVDAGGNLFIADYSNARVRKVSPDGTITTVAGGGNSRQEGVPATDAQLLSGLGIAVDSQGNLYIAEENGGTQKVSPDGTITTVAGGGNDYWNIVNGVAANSVVIFPIAVAVDFAGNLSIVDRLFNAQVRKVSPDGILTTIAGNGEYCCFGGDGGPAASAQLSDPSSVTMDAGGNVYIADAKNSRIRKVSPDGTITTAASACGWPDELGWAPCGVAVDTTGNLYTSDDSGVFRISPDGSKTKLADFGIGLAVDRAGNLFIADWSVVHKVSPDGTSSTVAGNGTIGFSGDGGPATAAQLSLPTALAIDSSGNLYIVDSGNRRIRMVSAAGIINTVVDATADFDGNLAAYGLGNVLITGLAADDSGLGNVITGLAVDDSGNIFFEELSTCFRRIRRASPDGTVTTIAGAGAPGYSGDGGPAVRAQINPNADEIGNTLALDASGNLYAVDGINNAVRILRPVSQIRRMGRRN